MPKSRGTKAKIESLLAELIPSTYAEPLKQLVHSTLSGVKPSEELFTNKVNYLHHLHALNVLSRLSSQSLRLHLSEGYVALGDDRSERLYLYGLNDDGKLFVNRVDFTTSLWKQSEHLITLEVVSKKLRI